MNNTEILKLHEIVKKAFAEGRNDKGENISLCGISEDIIHVANIWSFKQMIDVGDTIMALWNNTNIELHVIKNDTTTSVSNVTHILVLL